MPTKTELIWDGKYDATGKRVAPLRTSLPFQTVETVNESAQERVKSLFGGSREEQPWRNRLIWGDKKYVLPSLLPEFAGKVNLIYIDPPFDTGADFSFTATVPDSNPDDDEDNSASFTKEPSLIEQKAYRDTWGRGIDSYLQWFFETAVLMHELLAETGSIYVHLDWHMGSYGRAILDEVFGSKQFVNEIIWKRQHSKSGSFEGISQYGRIHESIYFYKKSEASTWNQQFTEYDEEYVKGFYKFIEPKTERRYQLDNITAAGPRKGASGGPLFVNGEKVSPPNGRHWSLGLKSGETVQTAMDRLVKTGRIWHEPGKMPRYKRYLDEMPGVPLQDLWLDIKPVQAQGSERLDYPTQKPESLLDRIVNASSNDGDLVFDCFVGSGTTAAVAEKWNRRWIACDLGRFSIHTTRKRLLGIPDVRPFVVQNLGKYERQLWQTGQFAHEGPETPEQAAARHRAYTEFILSLYHAQPIHGYTWLHGTRNGRMVHVGAVEAPISVGDVQNMAVEFKRAIGTGKDAPTTNGLDVLGWDFAFELNEIAKQQAQAAKIDMTFKRIPRDVMDKRAVAQGDIQFFELAALAVKASVKGKVATLTLTDFVIPPDDVPEEVRKSVTHWSQWIDYWAVDWDHQSDTFHNQWQTFRTRKSPKLDLSATYTYAEPGDYRVVVKVIDILGNDTTKTVSVKVK